MRARAHTHTITTAHKNVVSLVEFFLFRLCVTKLVRPRWQIYSKPFKAAEHTIPLFRREPGNLSVRVRTTRYCFHADSRLCQWQMFTFFSISVSAPDKIHATEPTLIGNHSIQVIGPGSLISLELNEWKVAGNFYFFTSPIQLVHVLVQQCYLESMKRPMPMIFIHTTPSNVYVLHWVRVHLYARATTFLTRTYWRDTQTHKHIRAHADSVPPRESMNTCTVSIHIDDVCLRSSSCFCVLEE